MDRREFFRLGARASLGSIFTFGIIEQAFGALQTPQKVEVNIPTYTIRLKEQENLLGTYACRVGAPWSQTPIGNGKIVKKRDQIVFRYLEGPQKGEVIERTYLDPIHQWEPMPYDRMKGMDFTVNGRMTGAVFHSTTDYWTVGTPKSHGCIGLRIDDMLKFYNQVFYPLPSLEIGYQTVFYDYYTDLVIFWCDIYNRGTNNLTNLYSRIGFPERFINEQLVRENISKINKRLEHGYQYIHRLLLQGKDPGQAVQRLSYQISREQLLYWRL